MSDQYYRFFPGDYLRDTQGLTLTENGAYRMLLDSYYSQEFLPDDIQELFIICRAYQEFEQKAVERVVTKYFQRNGNGHLLNRKAEEEIAGRRIFLEGQARKAKLGGEATKQKWKEGKITRPDARPAGVPGEGPMLGPPSPSPSLKIKTSSSSNDDGMMLFDAFWKNYPRKVGKGAARKAWKKIKNHKEVIEKMKAILPKQKQSDQWTRDNGQFIPHPSTYLNRGQWEDETIG